MGANMTNDTKPDHPYRAEGKQPDYEAARFSADLCKGEYIPALVPAQVANLSRAYLASQAENAKLRKYFETKAGNVFDDLTASQERVRELEAALTGTLSWLPKDSGGAVDIRRVLATPGETP